MADLDYPAPVGEKLLPRGEFPGLSKWKFFEKIGYVPHKGQVAFHRSRVRFKMLFAGARWGKSAAAAREVEPLIVTPNTRGWIVAPSYELGEREFRYIYEDLITGLGLPTIECSYNIRQGNFIIRFPWNSYVQVKSIKQEDSLLGEELDWVIMAECAMMPERIWSRYIRMRLHSRAGIGVFATSPKGFGWTFQKSRLHGNGKWETFHGDSRDNPYNRDTIDQDEMTKEDYSEQVLGIPDAKGGRCMSEFASNIHVHPCRHVLRHRRRYRYFAGVDFGYTHPFVMLWGARDYDGNWFIYREYFKTRALMKEHIRTIKKLESERVESRYADSAAPDDRREMMDAGLDTLKANKDIEPGIRTVKGLLLKGSPRTPSGRKIVVDPSCKELIRALEEVPWAESREDVKEVYVDKDNDPLDALRYMIHSVESAGAWGI